MLRQNNIVHIPRSQEQEIRNVLECPLDELKAVVEFAGKASPISDVEDLAEQCNKETSVSAAVAESVFTIGISLSRLQRGLETATITEVMERVSGALERAKFPDWEVQSQKLKERQPLLEKLVEPDGVIDIMAKARELLYDFQSVLLDSMVLTDVRYVYNQNASEIKGGLILHTLSLDFLEGLEPRQGHVVLSSQDVQKLISQLQRATKKADVTSEKLGQAGITDLTPKRNL